METIEASVREDPLDVGAITSEQRAALKRRLIREHPVLAERLLDPESTDATVAEQLKASGIAQDVSAISQDVTRRHLIEMVDLRRGVIVDAHTDVLLQVVVREGEPQSLELALHPGLFERYWLPRLEVGGVGVQICPLYGEGAHRSDPRERTLAQAAEFSRVLEENAERVCHVRTSAELGDPRLRLVLSLEGVEPLEGDPDAFEEWYERGVRTASLTWNHANAFAGGIHTPAQGLTDRGRALMSRFREFGVALDLAHASEQTWRDVLQEEITFSVTHAGCRAVCDDRRNLADWQLEALAERGGVLGMMALPFVVDPDAPTLSRWLDHFDHAVAVMGVEHVGLGADFVDQVPQSVLADATKSRLALDGLTGPEHYPSLITALRERGYEGPRLEAITGGNWLRILREVL
jgi:membrane dipeptidase